MVKNGQFSNFSKISNVSSFSSKSIISSNPSDFMSNNALKYTPLPIAPLISIIVPVFNAQKYLSVCLDSLINQTFNEIEILCVNDGSTDNSLEILETYAKKDLRIRIFNQENKGPGPARNVALDNVRGKYILFCDADDTLEPDACRQCCEIMENNQVDLVIFNARIIEDGRVETPKQNSSGQYISCVKSNNAGPLNKIGCIRATVFGSVWGYCFRADLINRYYLRFRYYMSGEDGIFLHSYLMIVNQGYAVDKIFYNYYAHEDTLISNAHTGHWMLKELLVLPIFLYETFIFALKNKMPFQEIYIFYWLFIWLKARR